MTSRRQFSLFEGSPEPTPAPDAPPPAPDAPPRTDGTPRDDRTPAPDLTPRTDLTPPLESEEVVPDGRSPDAALPVSALNLAARDLLEAGFDSLWVGGEVTNWRAAPSGHRYFSLRDEHAQVDCVLFQGDAWRLPTDPEDGMAVVAYGRPSLYTRRGRFQLIVRTLRAEGEGLWRLAFDRLRRKLAAEGLLDPSRKRPIPAFPRRIGVVTSRRGAALRDVLTVVRRRAPWTHVLIRHSRVQGEGAALELRHAIEALGRHRGLDLLILTRGGGSVEDLWCFNEESVARAVAACPVPVISAVGHEIDVTIVDLVADVRAATPSAAAELAVPDRADLVRRLRRLSSGLVSGLRRRTTLGSERARRLEDRLVRGGRLRLERAGSRLERASARLDALSPLRTLSRGYAVPTDPVGTVLRQTDMFIEGGPFILRVSDGRVDCTANRLRPHSRTGDEGGEGAV